MAEIDVLDSKFCKKITIRLTNETRREFKSALAFFDVGIQHAIEAFCERLVLHSQKQLSNQDAKFMDDLLVRAKMIQTKGKPV